MSRHTPEPAVTVRGPGDASIAIVGGVHGDEPSGIRAVERLLEADLDLQQAVKFVVANPSAAAVDERFLDTDLNRSFPGDPESDAREEQLAARLLDVLDGCVTVSLHSTHSQPDPMALVSRTQSEAQALAARLPVPYVVDDDLVEGTLTQCGTVVTIEAGCQHTTEATDTAERLARAFLRVTGATAGPLPDASPAFFARTGTVDKADADEYTLLVENFERVSAGTTYATAGDRELVAEEPFVPILMSECGYADILGYTGERVGSSLDEARERFAELAAPVSGGVGSTG